MNATLREILAFLIWVPFALPIGMLYGLFLTHVLDRNIGLAGGAVIIVFPAAILVFAVAIWLPVWGFWRQGRKRRLGRLAPLTAAILSAGAAYVMCSGTCFMIQGPEPFLAYFVIVPIVAAAFLHDRWSRAFLPAEEGGA